MIRLPLLRWARGPETGLVEHKRKLTQAGTRKSEVTQVTLHKQMAVAVAHPMGTCQLEILFSRLYLAQTFFLRTPPESCPESRYTHCTHYYYRIAVHIITYGILSVLTLLMHRLILGSIHWQIHTINTVYPKHRNKAWVGTWWVLVGVGRKCSKPFGLHRHPACCICHTATHTCTHMAGSPRRGPLGLGFAQHKPYPKMVGHTYIIIILLPGSSSPPQRL